MAALDHKITYNLHVTTPELRLICQALCSRLKPEDIEAAEALGNELATKRSKGTIELLKQNQQLLDNIINANGNKL